MTQILTAAPTILYDNVLYDNRANLVGGIGSEACDWRLGTKWSGTGSVTLETNTLTTPVSVCAFAMAAHDLSTGGQSISIDTSANGGASWQAKATSTPSSNIAVCESFTAATVNKIRLVITGGSGTWHIGVLLVGLAYTLPKCPTAAAPLKAPYRSEVPLTRYGTPLGTIPRATPSAMQYTFKGMTIAQIHAAAWEAFIEHIGYPTGLPFFMSAAWFDGTTTETLTWFCWATPGWEYAPNYKPGVAYIDELSLSLMRAQDA